MQNTGQPNLSVGMLTHMVSMRWLTLDDTAEHGEMCYLIHGAVLCIASCVSCGANPG